MTPQHWEDPAAKCFGLLLDGRSQTSGIRKLASEATLLLVFNAHHDVVVFTLPKVPGGRDWRRLVDTNLPEEDEEFDSAAMFKSGHRYEVTGHSMLLFLLRAAKPQKGICAPERSRNWRRRTKSQENFPQTELSDSQSD